MSAATLYASRLALIGEARLLREEQTELGPRLIEARSRQREGALQLQACQARVRGALDDPEQIARQIEADAADDSLRGLTARVEAIRERLGQIEVAVHEPLQLKDKDIQAHLKALGLARAAVEKLEDAATKQAELVAALAAGPDARAEHAARRAELSAKVLLGEAATADLERLDAEAAPLLASASAQAERMAEAEAVRDVLAARLVAAQQAVADLGPLSRLCAESIVASELEVASKTWQECAAREIEARNALSGLDQVFRSLGGNPPVRPTFEPLTISEAARLELERLRGEHRDLF